jgi:hypothetical protein
VAIVALTNSSSPVTVERATADGDPYERETQLNGLALNFDAHDHTSAKGLGVGRVQTSSPPAASGQVRANGDAWQWWGATAGAVRTAADLEGTQTISGGKTFTGGVRVDPNLGVGMVPGAGLSVLAPTGTAFEVKTGTAPGTTRFAVDQNGIAVHTPAAGAGPGVVVDQPGAGLQHLFQVRRAGGGKWSQMLGAADEYQWWEATLGAARMSLTQAGTLTVTTTAGQPSLAFQSGGDCQLNPSGNLSVSIFSGGAFQPVNDDYGFCGYVGKRWKAVYAVNGAIQTSSADMKQGITPLDPAACYQAAKDVRWYDYRYLPPAFTAPEPGPDTAYDEHDSNEAKAEKRAAREETEAKAKAAHAKMLVETAPARHQRGFVFPTGEAKDEAGGALPPVPDLFGLDDRESTTPQADLATLGCALQEVIRRLEALEGAAA